MQVHSVVSKMMIDEVLCGSWDQPTSTIVMHETQPTRLQDLCAQFTEKAGVLVDLNERALQLRTGGQREADEEGGRFGEGGSFQGSRRYTSPNSYKGLADRFAALFSNGRLLCFITARDALCKA